jgi:O-antigen/teichoic acid export membrane protein
MAIVVTFALTPGGLRALLRRRGWLLLDQILFSACNFGISIFVARRYGYQELASLGVAVSVALVVQGLQRPLYVVPTALRNDRHQARVFAGITGEHVLVVAAIVILAAVTLEAVRRIFVAGADLPMATIASVLIFAQSDFDRYVLVKSQRIVAPAALSAAYAITLMIAAFIAWWWSLPFVWFMAAIVVFAVGKGTCVAAMTAWPNFLWGMRLLKRDLRVRGLYALAATLSYSGFMHVPVFALSILSGPVQTAGFIAMRNLVQPFPILMRSFDIGDKLAFSGANLKAQSQLRSTFWRVAIFYFLIGGAAILLTYILSHPLISLTYGAPYLPFETIMLGHVTVFTLLAILYPLEGVINIARLFRSQIFWSTVSGTVGAAIALAACGTYGAWGAIAAARAGAAIMTTGTIYSGRHILFARDVRLMR